MDFVGKDDAGERMEVMELKDHPFFVGVQFHPEYLSQASWQQVLVYCNRP